MRMIRDNCAKDYLWMTPNNKAINWKSFVGFAINMYENCTRNYVNGVFKYGVGKLIVVMIILILHSWKTNIRLSLDGLRKYCVPTSSIPTYRISIYENNSCRKSLRV